MWNYRWLLQFKSLRAKNIESELRKLFKSCVHFLHDPSSKTKSQELCRILVEYASSELVLCVDDVGVAMSEVKRRVSMSVEALVECGIRLFILESVESNAK